MKFSWYFSAVFLLAAAAEEAGSGGVPRKGEWETVAACAESDSTVCLNAKEAKLCCHGRTDSSPASFVWYHKSGAAWKPLKDDDRYRFLMDSDVATQSLVISQVTQADEGEYYCNTTEKPEPTFAVMKLSIVRCPQLELNVTVNGKLYSRRIPLNELQPDTEVVFDVSVTFGSEADYECSIVTEDGTIVNTNRNPSISFKRNSIAGFFLCSTKFRGQQYSASFNFLLEPEEEKEIVLESIG